MAKNITIDQEVYVPRSAIGLDPDTPAGPFYRTKVREIHKRSVKVDMPTGPLDVSDWVGTSKLVLHLGVLIVRIGDYKEAELIEPLCKSVMHFCRLLIPGNLQVIEVRTVRELIHFWDGLHHGFEQVILIGHGDHGHIYFGTRAVSAAALAKLFEKPSPSPKEIISLCCQTGQQPFAKAFSLSSACRAFVAPFHSIHGVTASQFCQSYLTRRLLGGDSVGIAFNQARKIHLGTASFRLWQNGKLKAGPK
jgi:hypothetical protein